MAAAAAPLRAAEADGGGLVLDGAAVTCERVRDVIQAACREHGAQASDDLIVRPGSRGGLGHDDGSGRCRRASRSPSTSGRATPSRPASPT